MPKILKAMPPEAASSSLPDAEYHRLSREVLGALETTIDRWMDDDVIDIDSQRTGGMLELTFPDRSKIIVNTQPPLQELWLAARRGGYHFRHVAGRWVDTRDGVDFFVRLSEEASFQAGKALAFGSP